MEEVCHNCKSKDIFFDGELYKCIRCRYQWVPEVFLFPIPMEMTENERAKDKKED